MKKSLLVLVLAVACLSPFASFAQTHTITVANGTATNNNVPVYGYYCDSYLRSQTIYPAVMIGSATSDVSMTGAAITGITYYLSTPAQASWGNASFTVKLKEVNSATLTGFVSTDDATVVYSGSLDGTSSTMNIEFTTPYYYGGGNLLVEVNNITTGTYKSCSFYGVENESASWQGYSYSSWNDITGNTYSFIPKTTFSYVGGGGSTCYAVRDLHITDITSSSISIAWEDSLNTGATYSVYNILDSSLIASGLTTTSYTATSLLPNSLYGFYVAADCGSDVQSFWTRVIGRTNCMESTMPYFEDFDSMAYNAVPTCWHVMNGAPFVHQNMSNAHSGENFLELSGSSCNMIVMPTFTESLNGKQLYLYTRPENRDYRCGTLSVGYVTDLSDTSSFVSLADYSVEWWSDPVLYHEIEVNYDGVPANAHIAFRHTPIHSSYFWYIDDIDLRVQPTCFRPRNVHLDDATSNSVTISWHDSLNASGVTYSIYYWPDSTLVASGLTTTSYTVTGLTPNTSYVFAVLTDCSATDHSRWYPLRVRTNCDTLSLPYSENFDALTINEHPLCWEHPTHVNNTSNVCVVYNTSPHSGTKALRFSYASPTANLLMMPELAQSLAGLRLRFWYKAESATSPKVGTFEVGYVTNDVDTSTFIPIDTLLQTTTYSRFTASFPSDIPIDARIAFRHRATGENWYWLIDDVVVEEMPDCADITNLDLIDLSITSATISWEPTSAQSYEADLYRNGSVVQTWTGTTNMATFPVSDNQDYTVKVRGICGNDTSEWSDSYSFHVGYCIPNPTSVDNQGITNVTYGVGEVVNSNSHPTAAPYYGNYTAHVGAFPAGMPADVAITFSTGYTYGVLIWIDWDHNMLFEDSEIVFSGTSISANPNTMHCNFDIDYQQDTGTYRMRIGTADMYFDSYINNGDGPHDPCATTTYAMFMDYTVRITEAPDCLPVTSLFVDNATASSISLSWQHAGTPNATYSIISASGVVASGITATSYTVTGLAPTTTYTFGVVAHCSPTDNSDTVYIQATTQCASIDIPLVESFELTSPTIDCWRLVSMNESNGIGTSNGMGYVEFNSHRALRFSSYSSASDYNQYAFSPVFNAVGTDSLRFRVRYSNYGGNDHLWFGYITATDTVWSSQYYTTNSQNTFAYYTATIPASATQVAIHYHGNYAWYAWIDSVTVAVPPERFDIAVNCDTTHGSVSGAGSYEEGTTATLSATPESGYAFVAWLEGSDTVSTANPYSFVVTGDRSLTAVFQQEYTVSVGFDGSMGSVSGAGTFLAGSTVTLTATPTEGYVFVGWQEGAAIVSTANPYSFTLTADRSFVALFTEASSLLHTVTVNYNTDMGTVTGAGTYEEGATATLTATPNEGYSFVTWIIGASQVSTNPYSFVVTEDVAITAVFTQQQGPTQYTVTVNYNASMGTVTGAGTYDEGATVTLTAVPADGYEFRGWIDGIDEIDDNPYSFTLTADRTLNAIFRETQGIGTVDDASVVTIYPNPASTDVTVTVSQPSTLTLLDLQGRTVLTQVIEQPDNQAVIDVSKLNPGAYFVRISDAKGTTVRKLIVR